MIGHHARFRENDDLPLWRGPAAKKEPPFFNARALITCKIMRSRDAQCTTGGITLTRGLMRGTMAVHVRYNSWYVSLSSSAGQQL